METKPSQLLKDAQILMRIESILNEFYCGEQKERLVLRPRTCNKRSPRIERIEHRGQLRILAFSDYGMKKSRSYLTS